MSYHLNRSSAPATRATFFDLAGTLIEVRGGLGFQYAAISSQFGVRADPEAIDAAFPRAFRTAGQMVFPRTEAEEVASLERGFWKDVVRLVFADVGLSQKFVGAPFDAFFDRLFDHFATAAAWNVYPDVVPALDRLRRHGIIVGLITNFDHRVFPLLDAVNLTRLVDSITIPSRAGAAKPERAIFEHALARHGVRPSEAVQIGDSIRDDVEGAQAAGLRGVLIDRKGRRRSEAGDVPRIGTLDELLPLVGLQ